METGVAVWTYRLLEADILRLNQGLFGEHDRPLNHILQLAHIARPVIAAQFHPGRRRKISCWSGKLLRVLAQEVTGQQQNIVSPFPQWWQADRQNVQTVVEILPKSAGFKRLCEIDV